MFEILQKGRNGFVGGPGMLHVRGHVGVLVPAWIDLFVGVVDLNEANPLLGETTGHEALAAVIVGRFFANAIHLFGGFGFVSEIENVRSIHLHAKGEVEGLDGGVEVVVGFGLRLLAVEFLEEVELLLLLVERKGGIFEIPDGGLGRGEAGAADAGALVDGGEEGVGVVARAAFAGGGHDGDEAGKVLVFAAQSVGDPAAHGGSDKIGRAGVEEEGGGSVGDAFSVHGVDEAEVIDVLPDVWKEFADVAAGLAVLLEVPERLEELALALFAEGVFANADEVVALAIAFDELGFVIEAVDMAGTAGHEEEDDSFGSAGEGGRLGRERIGLGGLAQEGGKRKGAETASGGFEKLAAVRDHVG